MFTRVSQIASYGSDPATWEGLAAVLDGEGQTRLARTIRTGVKNQQHGNVGEGWLVLRFRDGSITKMDKAIRAYEDAYAPVED